MQAHCPIVTRFIAIVVAVLSVGCTPLALQPATSTGLVVYTKGATQYTARVQLARSPSDVFAGMLAVINRIPEVKVAKQDDSRFYIEVVEGSRRLSGQATDLGRGETLLFVWADAGDSGETGRELSLRAVDLLCAELGVECTMQDN